jgi:hypothetical protein
MFQGVLVFIHIIVITAAVDPQRAIRAFGWWVSELTDRLQVRDRVVATSQRHVEVVTSMMDVVFDCSEVELQDWVPSYLIHTLNAGIDSMVSDESCDIPESILVLRDSGETRSAICAALSQKLESANKTLRARILARLNVLDTMAWYEDEIARLEGRRLGSSTAEGLPLEPLVVLLERLRYLMERNNAIRTTVSRIRYALETTPQEQSNFSKFRTSCAVTETRLKAAVAKFVRDNKVDELDQAVVEIYTLSKKYSLISLERFLQQMANSLSQDKSDTDTDVLNAENLYIRGFVYSGRV